MRAIMALVLAMASLLPMTAPAQAANDRELYLYYTHTKETIRIVYKRNGKFVQSALNELNVFLRDWRRNEPARMDPALFDVLWEVYRQTGASQPIHIVSAYRSPQTNAMLASTSSGVADNSQHMQGKAIDFYIPGVPVSRIRELGFLTQTGGVGYYPNSGSPFVHLDTGSVRAWPRMTQAQLQQLFPDGRTLHIPSNGRVLSQEGYRYAQAEWQRCHRVPCNAGAAMGGSDVQVANSDRPRTLWDMITGGNNNQQQAPIQAAAAQPAPQQPQAAAAAPAAPVQQVAAIAPPAPPARPGDLIAGTMVADAPSAPANIPFQVIDAQQMIQQVAMADTTDAQAPLPPSMSRTLAEMREATPSAYAPSGGRLEVASIENAPTPLARPDFGPAVTASIAPQALEQASSPAISPDSANDDLAAFAALFDGAVLPQADTSDAAMDNARASLAVAAGELFAPQVETALQALTAPSALSSAQFAFDAEPMAAGSPGDMVPATGFTRTASLGHSSSAFGPAQTIWVHYDSAAQ
ncbi:DUF882 domain-containing protein [Pelagibacterium lacus]|uniref:Murein endopeptidase K n=2 Tax=Pelagibacterium lacus TaxID=2282655 RepID=A0A369W1Y4_9HYPH|nr:DUF882 domain-containing protein [Pelagibacterium lacus]